MFTKCDAYQRCGRKTLDDAFSERKLCFQGEGLTGPSSGQQPPGTAALLMYKVSIFIGTN